mmetsp:Transcript_16066/g.22882  ORF Transcript_16066/g.22882 Transcript_16066/m.22882 type:complete len:276 (+) Transcript_16066:1307-2134(+)
MPETYVISLFKLLTFVIKIISLIAILRYIYNIPKSLFLSPLIFTFCLHHSSPSSSSSYLTSVSFLISQSKNVLMVSETHDASIKLADFGFATWIYTPTSLTKSCGTPFFVAPEIIISNLKYDQIADMWSVGVILFMLLSGELPFKGTNLQGLYKAIIQQELVFDPSFWNGVSQDAQELVRGLLQKNPAKRMTAQQALNSSWFQGDSTRLALINLQETSKRLKVFNARRMWKVVGHAVMATNYFNNMIKLNQKNSATFEEEQHEFEKKIDKLIEEG